MRIESWYCSIYNMKYWIVIMISVIVIVSCFVDRPNTFRLDFNSTKGYRLLRVLTAVRCTVTEFQSCLVHNTCNRTVFFSNTARTLTAIRLVARIQQLSKWYARGNVNFSLNLTLKTVVQFNCCPSMKSFLQSLPTLA